MKIAVVILFLLLLGLAGALLLQQRGAEERLNAAQSVAASWSNRWNEISAKVEVLNRNGDQLAARLQAAQSEALQWSNRFNSLQREQSSKVPASDLAQVQAALAIAQAELKKRDGAIAELQAQRGDVARQSDEQKASLAKLETELAGVKNLLAKAEADRQALRQQLQQATEGLNTAQGELKQRDAKLAELRGSASRMSDLTSALQQLEAQIAEIKKQLAAGEADRAALQSRVRRLEAERAKLVAQWIDLGAVRAQYASLKDQADLKRRQEWLHHPAYGWADKPGAEVLLEGFAAYRGRTNTSNSSVRK